MSDNNSPPNSPDTNNTRPRRASFAAGQSLADLFRSTPRSPPNTSATSATSAYPGPITTAAAQAQSRRLSVTTIGLSGSPNQTTPFGSLRSRRGSIGSATSNSIDETAVEDAVGGDSGQNSTPSTPFARRMSFGARALRDRQSNAGQGANGRTSSSDMNPSSSKIPSSPPAASARGRGEGFSWSENMRTRAERTSMQFGNAGSSVPAGGGGIFGGGTHQRAQSVTTMPQPAQEMPKPKAPDHFQERILKGDFYMD